MRDCIYRDIDWVSNISQLGANSETSRFVERVLNLGWYQLYSKTLDLDRVIKHKNLIYL